MTKPIEELSEVVIRFAGDSGDGMQLSGTQFSATSGTFGNDVNTFPDYPSEIRAPEGTLYGVSAYQVHFGAKKLNTPGDLIDCLVTMNSSSLKVNLPNIAKGGIIIANEDGFGKKNLKLSQYEISPLEDDTLNDYIVHKIDMNAEVKALLLSLDMSPKLADRIKNIFALGISYWLYSRPMDLTIKWLKKKFEKSPEVLDANLRALQLGYEYAEKSEMFNTQYQVQDAKLEKGTYRNITGNEAAAIGMVTAAEKANLPLFLGSYPITPATEILQFLASYKHHKVRHLQAEDEIAGICSAIGAAYGGNLAVTTTSGPGLALKVEASGLALILELPLVIINVMRAGPSTGIPTKPEQSDLNIAMYGRHGDAPMPILAAQSSADCFDLAIEASRIALKYMTPVILLSDGYLAQGTEPWKIPNLSDLPSLEPTFASEAEGFKPYKRDPETLARNWAIPGTRGLEHRIGGLEKQEDTGLVSSDAKNHQVMTDLRRKKIEGIANDIPEIEVLGEQEGDLLILGWGSSYGAIKTAFDKMQEDGKKVSYAHLRYMNPFPKNLESAMKKFKRVLIPELNDGQLKGIIQSKFLIPVIGLNKVEGLPFKAFEIEDKVSELLNEKGA